MDMVAITIVCDDKSHARGKVVINALDTGAVTEALVPLRPSVAHNTLPSSGLIATSWPFRFDE